MMIMIQNLHSITKLFGLLRAPPIRNIILYDTSHAVIIYFNINRSVVDSSCELVNPSGFFKAVFVFLKLKVPENDKNSLSLRNLYGKNYLHNYECKINKEHLRVFIP